MSNSINATINVEIQDIGASGDGIGNFEGQKVFVPYTISGETVTARIVKVGKDQIKAELLTVEKESEERREPPCPHFTHCGGCNLQHIQEESYYSFKEKLLQTAVRRAGYEGSVIEPMIRIGAGTRRRANFKLSIHGGKVEMGFFEEQSRTVSDIQQCMVLDEAISRCILPLKNIIAKVGAKAALKEVSVTLSDTGLDIVFFAQLEPLLYELDLLGDFAREHNISRISWKSPGGLLTVISQRPVEIVFGEARVEMPVESFIQATRQGQEVIIQEVLAATAGKKNIVDLYAGCGTYSFPLAAQAKVHAVEGDRAMVKAITKAASQFYMGKVTVEKRDIYAFPLMGDEIACFDAAIINPPRNGASTQVEAIAASSIPVVVMVSCNPATFARDARILKEAGYRLNKVVGVDQFYLSHHLELVAVFNL